MNKTIVGAALAATASAMTVAAEAAPTEAAPAGTPALREGFYVAPMLMHLAPDAARCNVDGGTGFTLALGHRGEAASVELWGQFASLKHGGCDYTVPDSGNPPENPDGDVDDDPDPVSEPAGEVKLNGGGIALLVGPFSGEAWYTRFFGLVGVGMLQRQGHPQYAEDDSTIVGDLGAGYQQPLRLWEFDFLVRLEGRYRYDVQPPPHPDEQDPAPPHSYHDVVVNLGVQIPLSTAQPPPAAAEPAPVGVVPADTDDDGVNDDRDQCPETPAGSYVSNTGCAADQQPVQPTPGEGS